MILPLLERAARRTQDADAALKTDETLTFTFEAGRLASTGFAQESGVNLRVLVDGRVGFAGTTSNDPAPVLDAALASARVGEQAPLTLPSPRPMPAVATHYPRAGNATTQDLVAIGEGIVERLTRDDAKVEVHVERSIGSVRVANTRGIDASYDVSAVTIAVEVTRVRGDDVLLVSDAIAGADLPHPGAVGAMVGGLLDRMAWAERDAEPPAGTLPVLFMPSACGALLGPLRQALLGKSVRHGISPLAEALGERRFDAAFSLIDDPLIDGASGSRPVDDEGVSSRKIALIEHGTVRCFIVDLETAARLGVSPTGHGRRTTFGKPHAAYTNLVVGPGVFDLAGLLGLMPDGLLVDGLLGVGQGNVIGGAFSHPVAVGYRVRNGEIVGRVRGVAVAGNAYTALARIAGVGRELKHMGGLTAPPMLIEGISVVRR